MGNANKCPKLRIQLKKVFMEKEKKKQLMF